MGTEVYFEEVVKCSAKDEEVDVKVYKTNYAGEGPQLMIGIGPNDVILPHKEGKEFCEAVLRAAHYFGYID